MIRINLLATGPRSRKSQPQWDVSRRGTHRRRRTADHVDRCWFYASSLDEDIQAKQSEKQLKDKQVAQLKEQVKAVQDFEEKKATRSEEPHHRSVGERAGRARSKCWIM